jgi:signal transduction histidine kinase
VRRHDLTRVVDAAMPLLAALVVLLGVWSRAAPSTRALALALALAACAVLLVRRRTPLVALAASGTLALAVFAVDGPAGTIAVVAPAIALYTVALDRGGMHLAAAIVAAACGIVIADTLLSGQDAHPLTLQTASHVALVAVPVLAAEAIRNRRSYTQLLLERLELAERTREEEAARRAEHERLRIARELHDVVAHTLTTINVQAGVAAHLLDRDPGHVRGALSTIQTASHDALDELRAILGVLRTADGDGAAPLEPSPDLDAAHALVEQARATGLEVRLDVEGKRPERLPGAVQLAAFRILQESLTNVRRHAPGAAAHVTLAYREDGLRLCVENEARTLADMNGGGPGVGILGMRERAVALGGSLDAGCSTGRFHVVAELPYRAGP